MQAGNVTVSEAGDPAGSKHGYAYCNATHHAVDGTLVCGVAEEAGEEERYVVCGAMRGHTCVTVAAAVCPELQVRRTNAALEGFRVEQKTGKQGEGWVARSTGVAAEKRERAKSPGTQLPKGSSTYYPSASAGSARSPDHTPSTLADPDPRAVQAVAERANATLCAAATAQLHAAAAARCFDGRLKRKEEAEATEYFGRLGGGNTTGVVLLWSTFRHRPEESREPPAPSAPPLPVHARLRDSAVTPAEYSEEHLLQRGAQVKQGSHPSKVRVSEALLVSLGVVLPTTVLAVFAVYKYRRHRQWKVEAALERAWERLNNHDDHRL